MPSFDELGENTRWLICHLDRRELGGPDIIGDIIENYHEHGTYDVKVLINGKEYDAEHVLQSLDEYFQEMADRRAHELVSTMGAEKALAGNGDVPARLFRLQDEIRHLQSDVDNALDSIYGRLNNDE